MIHQGSKKNFVNSSKSHLDNIEKAPSAIEKIHKDGEERKTLGAA